MWRLIAGGRARPDSVGYAFGSSSIHNWQQSLGSMTSCLSVSDLQCAWILPLYCVAARPNYLLRVVHPGLTARFAAHHDASLRRALSQLVSAPPTQMFWDVVSLPFSRGGLGLRSAVLTTNAAFWSSWADSLQMIQSRHQAWQARFCTNCHTKEHSWFPCCCGCSTGGVDALGFRGPVVGECDSRSETCSA